MRANAISAPWDTGESSVGGRPAFWLHTMRRYFIVVVAGNLTWEFMQFPLYTLWWEGTPGQIVFAALHCTGGDILIAGASFVGSLLFLGSTRWPHERFRSVAALTLVAGLTYTMFSEWLNTEIRGSWAYTDLMPTLPVIGVGLAPLAQWIVVPLAAFWWAHRFIRQAKQGQSA